jgi:hypothetical protein
VDSDKWIVEEKYLSGHHDTHAMHVKAGSQTKLLVPKRSGAAQQRRDPQIAGHRAVFRVSGLGFRVSVFGFRVPGPGFQFSDLEFWVSGFKFRG